MKTKIWDKSGSKKYPYKLKLNYSVRVRGFPDMEHEWFKVKDQWLTMNKGYCIDGVTSYPDLTGLMFGAFPHDALLQGIGLGLMTEDYRSKTHKIFHNECDKSTWYKKISAKIAYAGLKTLHPLWHKLTK